MYKVEVSTNSDGSFKARSKDYEFVIDNHGKGITPPDTLLAGLGSCVGVYIKKYNDSAKLGIGDFVVSVEADFSQTMPLSFRKISVSVDLKGFLLDDRRKLALLAFVKNCPVHNTLKENPTIDVVIN